MYAVEKRGNAFHDVVKILQVDSAVTEFERYPFVVRRVSKAVGFGVCIVKFSDDAGNGPDTVFVGAAAFVENCRKRVPELGKVVSRGWFHVSTEICNQLLEKQLNCLPIAEKRRVDNVIAVYEITRSLLN